MNSSSILLQLLFNVIGKFRNTGKTPTCFLYKNVLLSGTRGNIYLLLTLILVTLNG